MNEIFGSIVWMVVVIGILVTFHEFGHYWVARRLGVRVLRFSVGFGRPLWSRTAANGTEFVIAAIPLGGYVRMLDEREGEVAAAERAAAFNRQPLAQRSAIVAAGPLFNLLFAVLAFWAMYLTGIVEPRPVIGETQALAAEAGLSHGSELESIDGRAVATWPEAVQALLLPAVERRDIEVVFTHPERGRHATTLVLSALPADFRESRLLEAIGLTSFRPDLPAVIGQVRSGFPAARAGIEPGDRIAAIAGEAVGTWDEMTAALERSARIGEPLAVTVVRAERRTELTAVPAADPDSTAPRAILGILPAPLAGAALADYRARYLVTLRYGPLAALGKALIETKEATIHSLEMAWQMLRGRASLDNLAGPISIAQMANASANLGAARFLWFLGIVSLSLAIVNLLPIPLLDGGHLLFNLFEWIKGSPPSEKVMVAGQYVGLAMLGGLIGLAIFNDLLRLTG